MPAEPVPAPRREEHAQHLTPRKDCCQMVTERRVAAGGTVMLLHRHQVTCPTWGRPDM
ncbi:hypothetical protein ACIQWA_07215 [Kitasatospora sp. NPDC098652]|uniref:hypothetical protein n=1 Tax=Kitasatospora sp. NPDC098652 TaxID=3364095 RepID=UPI003803FEC3